MAVHAAGDATLELDRVECAPARAGKATVNLTGRWNKPRRGPDPRAMLIVELDVRYRFPASMLPRPKRTGSWEASFTIPSWIESSLEGNTCVAVGDTIVPVSGFSSRSRDTEQREQRRTKPGRGSRRSKSHTGRPKAGAQTSKQPKSEDAFPDRTRKGSSMTESTDSAQDPVEGELGHEAGAEPGHQADTGVEAEGHHETAAGGGEGQPEGEGLHEAPLEDGSDHADLSPEAAEKALESNAAALHAELKERAASEGRIRGELADVRAELEARVANQARLTEMHTELRGELERLRDAVAHAERQRADVESRAVVLAAELAETQQKLSDAEHDRDQLTRERDELVSERDALTGEVTELRTAVASGIVNADSARAEAAGLREELARLGADLAAARQQIGTRDTGIDEAQSLLAEARALTASLREE